MAKTVKDLDLKVNELKKYFSEQLGRFQGEIEKIKTPNADGCAAGGKESDIGGFILGFDLFKAAVENQLKDLQSQISQLRRDYDTAQVRLDNHLQHTNRGKILLIGISETIKDEELQDHVVTVINSKMQLSLSGGDVYDCYRLGRKREGGPRPILVQFSTISTRQKVFRNRRRLKNSGLVITEVLSPMRYEIFKVAKQKFQKDCWSNNGRIGFKMGDKVKYVSTMEQFVSIAQVSVARHTDGAQSTEAHE